MIGEVIVQQKTYLRSVALATARSTPSRSWRLGRNQGRHLRTSDEAEFRRDLAGAPLRCLNPQRARLRRTSGDRSANVNSADDESSVTANRRRDPDSSCTALVRTDGIAPLTGQGDLLAQDLGGWRIG